MPRRVIKCRFCDWKTAAFYKRRSGYILLMNHVDAQHSEEYNRVVDIAQKQYEESMIRLAQEMGEIPAKPRY